MVKLNPQIDQAATNWRTIDESCNRIRTQLARELPVSHLCSSTAAGSRKTQSLSAPRSLGGRPANATERIAGCAPPSFGCGFPAPAQWRGEPPTSRGLFWIPSGGSTSPCSRGSVQGADDGIVTGWGCAGLSRTAAASSLSDLIGLPIRGFSARVRCWARCWLRRSALMRGRERLDDKR